jgi:hypothetical protein
MQNNRLVAWAQLALALIIYGTSSFVPYYAQWTPAAVSYLLGSIFLSTWWVTNGSAMALLICSTVGVLGSVWEASLCAFGKFRYISPDFLGANLVTHWIFWIWAGAALSGIHLATIYIASPHAQTRAEATLHAKGKKKVM